MQAKKIISSAYPKILLSRYSVARLLRKPLLQLVKLLHINLVSEKNSSTRSYICMQKQQVRFNCCKSMLLTFSYQLLIGYFLPNEDDLKYLHYKIEAQNVGEEKVPG